MNFGNWLQQELDGRNWSQRELSRRSGIPQGQISKIIRGSINASGENCISLAEALVLSREEVFRVRGWLPREPENPFEPTIDPRAEKLAKEISAFPKESRDITLKAVEAVVESAREFMSRRLDFAPPVAGD